MGATVKITKAAQEGLEDAPPQCQTKFAVWKAAVEMYGQKTAATVGDFNDKALKGTRKGQRSIRLNQKWRAIYRADKGIVELIEVLEVTPHEY